MEKFKKNSVKTISHIIIFLVFFVLIFDFFFADELGLRNNYWFISIEIILFFLFLLFEFLKWKTRSQSK